MQFAVSVHRAAEDYLEAMLMMKEQHGFQVILCRCECTQSKLHQPFVEIIFYTNTLNQKKQANFFSFKPIDKKG